MGKDREGRYVVKGATWVRPHEKGAKEQPAIKKSRVFLSTPDQGRSGGESDQSS